MLDQDEINALMAQSDDTEEDTESSVKLSDSTEDNSQVSLDDIDALISNIDIEEETVDEDIQVQEEPNLEKKEADNAEEILHGSQTWCEQKIKDATLPYPVEPEHKVVDQLSQVTEDGEIKAGEVFDSISDALEKLNTIDQTVTTLNKQCMDMNKFVMVLQSKFPQLDIFGKKSQDLQMMLMNLETVKNTGTEATNDLYKAMETMQYQDISRQKIERVISVVRKLSEYLNNVFEVNNTKEIKVAKHIHGDSNQNLADEEAIDDLIKKFGIDE